MRVAAAAVAALGAAVFVSHVSPAGAQEPTPPPGTARSPAPAGAASVRGRVTDQATGQPVASAQVAVLPSAGGRLGGLTDNSGEFTVTGVPAGQATVRVLRIGYAPVTQTVAVPATGQVTLTFALTRAVAQLEAVVTTATGLQSRREVGNAIA